MKPVKGPALCLMRFADDEAPLRSSGLTTRRIAEYGRVGLNEAKLGVDAADGAIRARPGPAL